MPSAAASTLADLASVLEDLGLRWYLFGAQAAIHYGNPRATADVDVTVEPMLAKLGELLADAELVPALDAAVARARS